MFPLLTCLKFHATMKGPVEVTIVRSVSPESAALNLNEKCERVELSRRTRREKGNWCLLGRSEADVLTAYLSHVSDMFRFEL